jgi:amino acid adenylation domain-containing protein/non-ribosomal peptide synthase protein (TIGR01720 family)
MIDLLKKVTDNGILLKLQDNELKLFTEVDDIDDDILQEIRENKEAIISYLKDNQEEQDLTEIQRIHEQESYPVSNAQKRLWVLGQYPDALIAYNMPYSMHLKGNYRIDFFKNAIIKVIERHEILRTVFDINSEGEIRQIIKDFKELEFEIRVEDLSSKKDAISLAENKIQIDSDQPFDLKKGPLLRVIFFKISEGHHIFYYNIHHIISDGWSMEVLKSETLQCYQSLIEDRSHNLPDLKFQYKDYTVWQLQQENNLRQQENKKYWLEVMQGKLPVIDLPSSKERPVVKTYNGKSLQINLNSELSKTLKDFVKAEEGSLFMGILTAIKILLFKFTSQSDIIIGTPSANRDLPGLKNQIGFYLNVLLIRTEIEQQDSFKRLFKKIKESTLKAYEHQDYPYDKLISDLNIKYNTSRSPITDLSITFHNINSSNENDLIKNEVIIEDSVQEVGNCNIKNDIEFHVQEVNNGISLGMNYNEDVYEKEIIVSFLKNYVIILKALLLKPTEKISEIDYLSDEAKHELIHSLNNTERKFPIGTLISLFEKQCLESPDSKALIYKDISHSYKELDAISNQLADCLAKTKSVRKGKVIGLQLTRSDQAIIAILGILKAGASYVPIDANLPRDRKKHIVEDSNIDLLITETEYLFDIDFYEGELFAIDVEFNKDQFSESALNLCNDPSSPAYIIYTSGSTGFPKGVLIEHGAIVNTIQAQILFFSMSEHTNSLQFASLSFDASVSEIFTTLISGKTLYLVDEETRSEPELLASYIEEKDINIATIPPSYLRLMNVESLSKMNTLITAGEAAVYDKVIEFLNYGDFINAYGPTEVSICASMYKVEKNSKTIPRNVPIGKPMDNAQIFILDSSLHLVPLGVVGEICVSGAGLARGYLNRESLTAEKFIKNPFVPGSLMYRTGDLGRWLSDGTIEYLGRKDDQVKIRGHRVELGEITRHLQDKEGIDQALVVALPSLSGSLELVCYLRSSIDQVVSELRSYLSGYLPDYMIPSHYIPVEEFPLTRNGKLDKSALPGLDSSSLSQGVTYHAPVTPKAIALVSVCESVLGRSGIGMADNFYNLGGDSIKSIQVVSRLKQQGYSVSVESILRHPVLEDLLGYISSSVRDSDQGLITGIFSLTAIQRYFFESSLIVDKSHYNQSVLLESRVSLESVSLNRALESLVAHHDILRSVYYEKEGVYVGEILGSSSGFYHYEFHDLRGDSNYASSIASLGSHLQQGMDLGSGPLFGVCHFRTDSGDYLGLVSHHLLIDGVSWRILLEDLSGLYVSIDQGSDYELPLKSDSFLLWSSKQHSYVSSGGFSSDRSYWSSLLNSNVAYLPVNGVGEFTSIIHDNSVSFSLESSYVSLLQESVSQVYNTEINDILLSCLGLSLLDIFGVEQTVLKMEGHGREHLFGEVDVSRTVGWFTSIYPHILETRKDLSVRENLVVVKESLRGIPSRGISYGLLRYLSAEGLQGTSPNYSVEFNYLGDFGYDASGGTGDTEGFLRYSGHSLGSDSSSLNSSDSLLSINGMLVSGELHLSVRYSSSHYDASTMRAFMDSYQIHLESLISELSQESDRFKTPSDLTYDALSMREVLDLSDSFGGLEDAYELSPLQQGIYYHWLTGGSSSAYFEQMSYRVSGAGFSLEKIRSAYNSLIRLHGVLRTRFTNDYGGVSLQVVSSVDQGDLRYIELPEGITDIDGYVSAQKESDRLEGFDLSRPYPMRLQILSLGSDRYEFIWSHHHIIMDGWCISILLNDFYRLLSGADRERVPVPYSAYISWLSELDMSSTRAYWREYLSGYDQVATIPFTRPDWDKKYYENQIDSYSYHGNHYDRIDSFCKNLGITHNTLVQGIWGYLLSRYNDRRDVVFGSVVSGRPADLHGVEEMVGLFINTIPVRVSYNEETLVADLLVELQELSIAGTPHHYMNLSEVQSLSELNRLLIDHIMIFENYPIQEYIAGQSDLNEDGLEVTSVSVYERTNYDFNLVAASTEDSLLIEFRYNAARYDAQMLAGVWDHFDCVLEAFITSSDSRLLSVSYLPLSEQTLLLQQFNQTSVSYPSGETLVSLFRSQVLACADATALVYESREMSYGELDRLSNQLAHYLISQGVMKETLVGIMLERSEWLLVSILAVLKSGGAYVPIDSAYPSDRIEYMLTDSNCHLNIDTSFLKDFQGIATNYPVTPPEIDLSPDQLVYVIYTSGTTGYPKGTLIEHRNVVRLFYNEKPLFDFSENDIWCLFHSYCFDFSIWEIFGALLFGGKLVIVPSTTVKDTFKFAKLLEQQKVTILNQTPSAFEILQDQIINNNLNHNIRNVIFGGEALMPSFLKDWKEKYPNCKLINMYGITETTVHVTYKEITEKEITSNLCDIGKPIPTLNCMILDSSLHLVPIGVVGEICVSGAGLARGYLNRESLTAEKFIMNPFEEGRLMYRTGDLGRWLSDGTIEYLGRKDDQVKIRGHRVELGEITRHLQDKEGIDQALVVALPSLSGSLELVCYLRSSIDQVVSELRSYLSGYLPDYMIPSHYIPVEEFPLTRNGKLDKSALPGLDSSSLSQGVTYHAPVTPKAIALVSVCESVLGRSGIGMADNFYNLGGDSIKSIQVVSRLKQQGYSVSVESILRHPVLEDLLGYISSSVRDSDQGLITGIFSLTAIQRYFFESSLIVDKSHYNQSVLLESRVSLESVSLNRALESLVAHHDILRSVYYEKEGVYVGEILGSSSGFYHYEFHDLRGDSNYASSIASLGSHLQQGMDLGSGPLFGVCHFRTDSGDYLGLVSHHLLIDGVSWRILLEDLSGLYVSIDQGSDYELPLKSDSFLLWSSKQHSYVSSGGFSSDRSYWSSLLNSNVAYLPVNGVGEFTSIIHDNSVSFSLESSYVSLLQESVSQVYNTEINDILLSCLGLSLLDIFGVEQTVLKMEGHGREHLFGEVDVSRTVGWFTSIYPHILETRKDLSVRENLVVVKESLRGIPSRGISYGLLRYLSAEGLQGTSPNYSVEFNYLGDFGYDASGGTGDTEGFLRYSGHSLGSDSSSLNSSDSLLSINGMLVSGELHLSVRYSSSHYDASTMRAFMDSYQIHLESLISELSQESDRFKTPSDLTYDALSMREVLDLSDSFGGLEDAYELSPLQQGIYYHWLTGGSSSAYFEQMSYRVSGAGFSLEKIRSAYNSLIRLHGVLRTRFTNDYGGVSLQVVSSVDQGDLRYIELPEGITDIDGYVSAQKESDRLEGFDLSRPYPMRLQILSLGSDRYEFIWSHHHIIMDGWCISILLNDFYRLLSGADRERVPVPYSAYISWLSELDMSSTRAYWREYLSGYDQVATIPFTRPDWDKTSFKLHTNSLQISGEFYEQVIEQSKMFGVTLNTFIQAIWGYLLSRYNDRRDVVFGSVVSGRPADLHGVEEMVGLFINTIPVRVSYNEETLVADLLVELQELSIAGTPHHYMNLSEVQSLSELNRLLIDHIMVFENYPIQEAIEESEIINKGNLKIESVDVLEDEINYDFSLTISPNEETLKVDLKFNSLKYDATLLENVLQHFQNVMKNFTKSGNLKLKEIDYLTDEEEVSIEGFNNTNVSYPLNDTMIDLFEEQTQINKNKDAIRYEEISYSYQDLSRITDNLAVMLKQRYNLNGGEVIGVMLSRTHYLPIAAITLMKLGCVYVPIDPEFPAGRINYIIKDAGIDILMTETNYLFDVEEYEGNIYVIDVEFDENESVEEIFKPEVQPKDSAYIIYTSGTTGNPKGVLVGHSSLYNYLRWAKEYYLEEQDTNDFGLFTTISFDLTLTSLFLPLISGGTLTIFGSEIEPVKLLEQYLEKRISAIKLTPVHISMLSGMELKSDHLKLVIAGGDKLNRKHIAILKDINPSIKIFNEYGPTEATVGCIVEDVSNASSNVLIGKPIANTKIHILDSTGKPSPIGAYGEIYIAGKSLAIEYYKKPELTKERFVIDSQCQKDRAYRTGDIARWLKNGKIEYKGRKDNQIKIRGYRVELKEIESLLMQMELITEAVAVSKTNGENQILAVFYVSHEEINENDLRVYLSRFLPNPMIPNVFRQIEEIPVTINGKVDYQKLPEPFEDENSIKVQPESEIAKQLQQIWSEILMLPLDRIGVNDLFFNLGGNSLTIVQLSQRINREMGIEIPVADLFETNSISSIVNKYFKDENEIEQKESDISDAHDISLDILDKIED